MKTVAFLQNQWFKNPDKARQVFARNLDLREKLIARYLFAGCLTGRRLREVFGDLCNQIVWEETSANVGGHAASRFPPDASHMARVIVKHRADAVLFFGSVAQKGMTIIENDCLIDVELLRLPLAERYYDGFQVIRGPHPAARNRAVEGLRKMLTELNNFSQMREAGIA